MTPCFETEFSVRFYECDAYGHLNHANYLRYMQEAAFAASAAVGYDKARYDELGLRWLIRETDIRYLRPFRYGDTVKVRTWVQDFHRVRSRRLYELRHAESNTLYATATTDWVLLSRENGRPQTVPAAMVRAFLPDGPAANVPPRKRLPPAPAPPPGTFSMQRAVEWHDIDPAQHVNNAVYLTYIEAAGVQVAAAHGWPMDRMMAAGFGIVAHRYWIEYKQAAVFGDKLAVHTYISDVKRVTAVRHYSIQRQGDGALLARARVLWVWVDLATGKPIRIPADFLAAFQENIAT